MARHRSILVRRNCICFHSWWTRRQYPKLGRYENPGNLVFRCFTASGFEEMWITGYVFILDLYTTCPCIRSRLSLSGPVEYFSPPLLTNDVEPKGINGCNGHSRERLLLLIGPPLRFDPLHSRNLDAGRGPWHAFHQTETILQQKRGTRITWAGYL